MNSKELFRAFAGMAIAGVLFNCGEFPTRYERIETDKIRNIGVTLLPQNEGAPGDTIHARAWWSGKPVQAVSWQFSYDRILTLSADTTLNLRPLQILAAVDRLPDSIDFSFVIPDSVFFKTRAISAEVLAMARKALPQGMQSMTQTDYAAFLSDIATTNLSDMAALGSLVSRWSAPLGVSAAVTPGALDTFMAAAGVLVQAFSIKGVLMGEARSADGQRLRIKGEFGIRYNSRLQNTPLEPMFPVNRNPAVRWAGVYKIKNINGLPAELVLKEGDSLMYLYNEFMPWKVHDTVLIEKGYTYYLAADSGMAAFSLKAGDSAVTSGRTTAFASDTILYADTVLDTRFIGIDEKTGAPVIDTETYTYDWQFQNLATTGVTQPQDSLFVIVGAGQGGMRPPVIQFLPSIDKKMTRARIWITVSDFLYGDYNRPTGQTTRVVDLNFIYTE